MMSFPNIYHYIRIFQFVNRIKDAVFEDIFFCSNLSMFHFLAQVARV